MSSRRVKLKSRHRGMRRRRRRAGVVIGLTGSLAMGKSTAAAFLKYLGVPVFDADAAVRALTGAKGKAVDLIARRFPGVVGPKGVDRKALGAKVFSDPKALADLEAIVHPLVQEERDRFLARAARGRRRMVALDIPLLFEGGSRELYDAIVVISAPDFLQRQRALARPAMTPERLRGILSRQWSDVRKRSVADAVIPSGLGKHETLRRLRQFLTILSAKSSG